MKILLVVFLLGSPIYLYANTSAEKIISILPPQIPYSKISSAQLEVMVEIINQSEALNLDTKQILAVAWCESNFISTAKNKNSSATGIFQFLTGTWDWYSSIYWSYPQAGRNRLDYKSNIELALKVISDKGYTDWTSSYNCWRV